MVSFVLNILRDVSVSLVGGFITDFLVQIVHHIWTRIDFSKTSNHVNEPNGETVIPPVKQGLYRPKWGIIITVGLILLGIFFIRSLYIFMRTSLQFKPFLAIGSSLWAVLGLPMGVIMVGTMENNDKIRITFLRLIGNFVIGALSASTIAAPVSLFIYLYSSEGWNIGSIIFVTLAVFIVLGIIWGYILDGIINPK